ncbi:MAG: hypothetical protein JXA94_03780 [Parachlamydiales bacterium]|nr:hypothetical protein [Parachlamydiales bacterium]
MKNLNCIAHNISGLIVGTGTTIYTTGAANFMGYVIPAMIKYKSGLSPPYFRIIDNISNAALSFISNAFWPACMKGHSLVECNTDTSKSQTVGNIVGFAPGLFACLAMSSMLRKSNETYESLGITATFSTLGLIAGRKLHLEEKKPDSANSPNTV